MPQHYSDPTRADDPNALPNIETFEYSQEECDRWASREGYEPFDAGWFYWFCFPGCLPDGPPIGPFATEAEALENAREGMDDGEA